MKSWVYITTFLIRNTNNFISIKVRPFKFHKARPFAEANPPAKGETPFKAWPLISGLHLGQV